MDPINFPSTEGSVGIEQAGGKDYTSLPGRTQNGIHSLSKTPWKFNAHKHMLWALSLRSFWVHTLSQSQAHLFITGLTTLWGVPTPSGCWEGYCMGEIALDRPQDLTCTSLPNAVLSPA